MTLPTNASSKDAHESAELMTKHLVDIGDGRHLNLICVGQGSPTIVFEQGLGSHLLHWAKVVGPASEFAQACFYDRAGYGYSDPSNRPSTAMNATSDLHTLLQRAGLRGPFILVGHSLGGLFLTLYADRFGAEVAGLVLVEPSFTDQDKDESDEQRKRDAVMFEVGVKHAARLRCPCAGRQARGRKTLGVF